MTEQDLDICRKLKEVYITYKQSQVMRLEEPLYSQANDLNYRTFGVRFRPCGSCLATSIHSLLIHSGVGDS